MTFSTLVGLAVLIVSLGTDALAAVPVWGQCGGIGYSGDTTCAAGSHCEYLNDWYSQCQPGDPATTPQPTSLPPTSTSSSPPSSSSSPTSSTDPVPTHTSIPGSVVWDGNFNNYSSPADFDKWSWANQVGQYQWYIHGSSATGNYLQTSPDYKNPAITKESRGLKLSIDSTSSWNGQTMGRTEIIPQTNNNLGTGTMFYHFSISNPGTNPPTSSVEHQIMFFESHFTELKYGVAPNPSALHWMVSANSRYSVPFTAGVWYNFAYEINFSSRTCGLWASEGGADLVKVVNNVSCSPSTNSADFHVGVLRLQVNGSREDYLLSGVYVEAGSINTKIATW